MDRGHATWGAFWVVALLDLAACSGESVNVGRDAVAGRGGQSGVVAGAGGSTNSRGGSGANSGTETGGTDVSAVGGASAATNGTGAASGADSGSFGGIGAIGAASGAGWPGEEVCGPNGCSIEPNVPSIDPPGPVMCGGVACQDNEVCCLLDGHCFDPKTNADECVAPPPNPQAGGTAPCASNTDCNELEFCQLDDYRLCQGTGHCQPIGNCGACGDDGSGRCTVCACDGNTYPNYQTACLARASVQGGVGSPGAACGTPVTIGGGGASNTAYEITPCGKHEDCASSELCCSLTARCYPKADPGQCATPPAGTTFPCTRGEQCEPYEYCKADGCEGPGGCALKPDDCGVTLEPVCGCDGTTYTSAACAFTRGVRVAAEGECGG